MITICPICKSKELEPALFLDAVAIHQLIPRDLMPTKKDFHKFDIVQCVICSHLFNRSFSQEVANRMYRDTPLSNILVHVSMMESLEQIVEKIGVHVFVNKKVIEIGAGTGHLARIIAREAKEVTVFEPCLGLKQEMIPEGNITLCNKNFSSNGVSSPVDFIVCRQVIEHLDNPYQMLSDIVACLTKGGIAYLEVPCAEYIYKNLAIGDFHFAHVQYFTERNFLNLCRQCGLQLVRSFHLKNGHDIGFLLVCQETTNTALPTEKSLCLDLKKKLLDRRYEWRSKFRKIPDKVALYGATRNGQAVLDIIGDLKRIYAIFDDNSRYEGYSLYNQNQVVPVQRPNLDTLSKVSAIIITSYLHQWVISERLRVMGFRGQIITASPEGCPENDLGMVGLFDPILK